MECSICKNRKDNDITCDKKKQNKPWFDYECKKARDIYYRVRNKMKFFNSKDWEEKLNKASKCLKTITSKKKSEYFDIVHKKNKKSEI